MLETLVPAGDTTPVHTHLPPTVMYVPSGSGFIRRDPDGTVKLDTSRLDPLFEMPSVLWSDGNPAHTLEDTGPR